MPLYFLALEQHVFHDQLRPVLSAAWRTRSFQPCAALCATLRSTAGTFGERYHLGAVEPLLLRVAESLPFDRHRWRHLAGELLWYSAVEIPEFQTCPDTLQRLLHAGDQPVRAVDRASLEPIWQAHYGARDLVFGGGYYRPEHAGYNDCTDIAGLSDFLAAIDMDAWSAADLVGGAGLDSEAERAEELAFAREWFPSLRDLYQRACAQGWIIVCEEL